jgi:hypothetical protein
LYTFVKASNNLVALSENVQAAAAAAACHGDVFRRRLLEG